MIERTLKKLVLVLFFGILTTSQAAFAQNLEKVEKIFRCENFDQLIETFDWSGTRSTVLISMMRSIQTENLNSGFERQIISELQKKPWRLTTIKELEAEFQVIRGQYNADLISEQDARLRLACELAKYLHRDYLQNFDRASIFSSQSAPYAFYAYVRENNLWQNLTNPDLDEDPIVSDPAEMDNTIESTETTDLPDNPDRGANNIDLLTILYWAFLLLIGWIVLSVISGSLLKNQRFTNPVTRQVFAVLLWPFKLIEPFLANRPPGEKKFHGLSQKAYGNPLSEEQLRLMIDNRIAETEKEKGSQPSADSSPTNERMNALEAQLAKLEQEQQHIESSAEPTPTDTSSLQQVIIALEAKVESLHQKIDRLHQQFQESEGKETAASLTSSELAKIKAVFREELDDYKQDIDEQLLQITAAIANQFEEEDEDDSYEEVWEKKDGTSVAPIFDLEFNEEEEEEDQKEEEDEEPETEEDQTEEVDEEPETPEFSSSASDQLDFTPIPAEDRPKQYIYYASSPQKGIFYGKRLESGFIPKQTVYKITIDKDEPDHATFTMVTHEPTIRLALNILDSYVLPAMDLEGPGNLEDATDIGPVEAGELKKEGDDWFIVKKGVLHYR